MAITDKAAKGAKEALELIIGKSKAGTKAARVIPPPLPPRPPAAPTMMGHNGGPLLDIPYTMRGDAIAAALAGHPSARSIMRGEPNIVGSGVTNIGSQKATALSSHTSGGLLDPELLPAVPLDISSIKDYTLMGIVGDNSGRKRVTDVMGRQLPNPVDTQGGFQYIDRGTQGYAGAQSATSSKLNEAMETENPLYTTILMSEQSPDFAVPTSQIFGGLLSSAPISSKNAPKINEAIRNIGVQVKKKKIVDGKEVIYGVTEYPFKDFQDITVPGYFEAYVSSLPGGTLRAGFLKGMDKAGLQSLGLPRVSDARLAMADEGQIGMDWGTAGYRAFVPDMERGMYATTPDQSLTYSHGIDKVGPSYTFTEGSMGIPYPLMFPDVSSVMRAKGTGGGLEMTSAAYKVFEGSPKRAKQPGNDMVIDLVSTFLGIEKKFGREAAMRFAADTVKDIKVTPAIIEAARKANAPNWVIAAMAPTTGLLSMSPEEAEAQEAPRAKKDKR
jgi:hypothetical protein